MKLIKKKASAESNGQARFAGEAIDRRTFLRRSGLAFGGAVVATALPPFMMRKAHAAEMMNSPKAGVPVKTVKTICNFCAVGCGIYGEVQNGVWTGQDG